MSGTLSPATVMAHRRRPLPPSLPLPLLAVAAAAASLIHSKYATAAVGAQWLAAPAWTPLDTRSGPAAVAAAAAAVAAGTPVGPVGRTDAMLASDGARYMYLFGGAGPPPQFTLQADLWMWDAAAATWYLLDAPAIPTNGSFPWVPPADPWPRPRGAGVMVRSEPISAGIHPPPAPTPKPPPHPSTLQAYYAGGGELGSLFLFGGYSYSAPSGGGVSGLTYLNRGWVYTLQAATTGGNYTAPAVGGSWANWVASNGAGGSDPSTPVLTSCPLATATEFWPAPRAYPAAASRGSQLYVTGGYYWQGEAMVGVGLRCMLTDAWVLDMGCRVWRRMAAMGERPSARFAAATALLSWSLASLAGGLGDARPALAGAAVNAVAALAPLADVVTPGAVDVLLVVAGEVEGYSTASGVDVTAATWALVIPAAVNGTTSISCAAAPLNVTWVQLALTSNVPASARAAAWAVGTPQADAPPSGTVLFGGGASPLNPTTLQGVSTHILPALGFGGGVAAASGGDEAPDAEYGAMYRLSVRDDVFVATAAAAVDVLAANTPMPPAPNTTVAPAAVSTAVAALANLSAVAAEAALPNAGPTPGWWQVPLYGTCNELVDGRYGIASGGGGGIVLRGDAVSWLAASLAAGGCGTTPVPAPGAVAELVMAPFGATFEDMPAGIWTLTSFPLPPAPPATPTAFGAGVAGGVPSAAQYLHSLPLPSTVRLSWGMSALTAAIGVVYACFACCMRECAVRRTLKLAARVRGDRRRLALLQAQERHAGQLGFLLRRAGASADHQLAFVLDDIEAQAAAAVTQERRAAPDAAVDALPILTFRVDASSSSSSAVSYLARALSAQSVVGPDITGAECPICLTDYAIGDKLRRLPCAHYFHGACVDHWLRTISKQCPTCKHDVMAPMAAPPAPAAAPPTAAAGTAAAGTGAAAAPEVELPAIQSGPTMAALRSHGAPPDAATAVSNPLHTAPPTSPPPAGATK